MAATVSFDIELVTRALEENLGNIGRTAKKLGVAESTLRYWVRSSDELREACNQAREALLDRLVGKVTDKALGDEDDFESGDSQCCFFLLKALGKERGFGDKPPEADKLGLLGQMLDPILKAACQLEDERRLPAMKNVPPLKYKHPDLPPDGAAKAKQAKHRFNGKKK